MALPPGPPLPGAVQTLLWIRYPIEMMRWCREHYGRTFSIHLLPFRLVLVSDPESIAAGFALRPDDMFVRPVNRILRVLVGGSSLLLLDGAEHLRHRRLLLPSFHGERMRHYGSTMAEITRKVSATWPADTPFAIHPHTQHITLEIILRTVFGAEEGAQANELARAITRMLRPAENRLALPAILYMSEHPEVEARAPWKWALAGRNRVDDLLFRQIASRRVEAHEPRAPEHTDVLAMLLQARDEDGKGLSDRELRDDLMTALAAGHETTATALAWAVERLCVHPDVYRRLAEEVRAQGPTPDPERLATLPYLDAVTKEVLRQRPVIPLVGRVLKKPIRLDGRDLPAGTYVAPCVYLAHHDPQAYPEPDRFMPERFLERTPDPSAWFPFGGGVRRCAGAQFALYEMKIVLGTLLAEFDFELARRAPLRVLRRAITFWPEGGTPIRCRRLVRGGSRAA